ncbi:MAG TPA: 50S ribosomal protein L10 [Gemmataceae bacterium]|jgi:large subunit ribosomal protein L10|nr:50S ribosomal protein L10 [Gemmataceae bacterium]
MSKQIKQMEMDALKATFAGVRDLVVLTASGVSCQTDNQLRLGLRRKNIRLQVVKNSLARRVFDELGLQSSKFWDGPTVVAWGASSLAELSRELDAILRKNERIKPKGAIAEGQEVTFKQALLMPTRAEAIGRVVGLVLSPASRLLSQIMGPASRIVSQIKTLSEKTEAAAPDAGAAPASVP